ncbi:MAG: chorismate mutase type family protein [Micavibrio sp.]|nr:chorismate mutase type family protein [Micavibrio sp.]
MEILKPYRARIDALDDKIVDLLIERVGIIREVGHLKAREGIPAILPDRVTEVRERAAARAAARGLDADLVRRLYTILIDYSCNLEEEIKAEIEKAA